MPTAREDLAPQVQAGCGRGEHDQVLLLQAKAAHARGWAVVARPGEDLLIALTDDLLLYSYQLKKKEGTQVNSFNCLMTISQALPLHSNRPKRMCSRYSCILSTALVSEGWTSVTGSL